MSVNWGTIGADCRAALWAWNVPTPEADTMAAVRRLERHTFNGLQLIAGYVAEVMFRTTMNYPGANQLAHACYDAIPPDIRVDEHGSAEIALAMVDALLTEPFDVERVQRVITGGVHGQNVTQILLTFSRTSLVEMQRVRGKSNQEFLTEMFRSIANNDDSLTVFTAPIDLLGKRLQQKGVDLFLIQERPDGMPDKAIGWLYVYPDGRRQLQIMDGLTLNHLETLQIFKLVMARLERLGAGQIGEDFDWQHGPDGQIRTLLGEVDDLPPL